MGTRFSLVDSFTDRPFAGNPAGVCLLTLPRKNDWMQSIAAEIGASETAFIIPDWDGWMLRWFTPKVEVDLCGHATLAAAHVLWEGGFLPADSKARFQTRSGVLTAARRGEWIEMDFPATAVGEAIAVDGELTKLLGAKPVAAWDAGWTRLVELNGERDVREARPDFAAMAAGGWGSAIVTARGETPGVDFVSRFFAPAVGINEDPVTGSAHCVLGPFWAKRLGRDELVARQVSARGGAVRVRVDGERVKLSGQAVTTLKGELT